MTFSGKNHVCGRRNRSVKFIHIDTHTEAMWNVMKDKNGGRGKERGGERKREVKDA